jgi:hypothetical protein
MAHDPLLRKSRQILAIGQNLPTNSAEEPELLHAAAALAAYGQIMDIAARPWG